jgi:hypothetical protein
LRWRSAVKKKAKLIIRKKKFVKVKEGAKVEYGKYSTIKVKI